MIGDYEACGDLPLQRHILVVVCDQDRVYEVGGRENDQTRQLALHPSLGYIERDVPIWALGSDDERWQWPRYSQTTWRIEINHHG